MQGMNIILTTFAKCKSELDNHLKNNSTALITRNVSDLLYIHIAFIKLNSIRILFTKEGNKLLIHRYY